MTHNVILRKGGRPKLHIIQAEGASTEHVRKPLRKVSSIRPGRVPRGDPRACRHGHREGGPFWTRSLRRFSPGGSPHYNHPPSLWTHNLPMSWRPSNLSTSLPNVGLRLKTPRSRRSCFLGRGWNGQGLWSHLSLTPSAASSGQCPTPGHLLTHVGVHKGRAWDLRSISLPCWSDSLGFSPWFLFC